MKKCLVGHNAALLLIAFLFAGGHAAKAEPKSQDAAAVQALKKAQGVLRQLAQEKATLEAEKTALSNDKAGLENRVRALEESVRKLQPLQGEVERLTSSKGNLENQVSQSREREQSLLLKYREVVDRAKAIRSDNQLLVQAVREREQWIEQCGERNTNLRAVTGEIIDKYREKGFWDELAEIEPFTGIAKVSSESAAESYHYKLQNLKITPFQSEAQASGKTPSAENSDDGEDEEKKQ